MKDDESHIERADLVRFVGIGTCAVMVPLVMPMLMTAASTLFSVPSARAANIAVAEMAGSGIGALLVSIVLIRRDWRATTVASFAGLLVVNVATLALDNFALVLPLRLFSGIGAGVCLGLASAGLAGLRNTERSLAIFFVTAFMVSAAALRILPPLLNTYGPESMFIVLAAAATIGLMLSVSIRQRRPAKSIPKPNADTGDGDANQRAAWTGVVGVLGFFMGIGSLWTFFSQIGIDAGLDSAAIGRGLGLGGLSGGVGALAAVLVAERAPRSLLLAVGLAAAAGAAVLLWSAINSASFAAAALLLLFSWNFTFPFMLGLLEEAESSGRFVPMGIAMSSFGFAGGPALTTLLLGEQVTAMLPGLFLAFVVVATLATFTTVTLLSKSPVISN